MRQCLLSEFGWLKQDDVSPYCHVSASRCAIHTLASSSIASPYTLHLHIYFELRSPSLCRAAWTLTQLVSFKSYISTVFQDAKLSKPEPAIYSHVQYSKEEEDPIDTGSDSSRHNRQYSCSRPNPAINQQGFE